MTDRCRHCHGIIRSMNYALGEKWMHVDPNASFPTTAKGTAWMHCRLQVAEPEQAVNSILRDDSATVAAISPEDFQLALDAPYDASCHTCGHTKGQHYSTGPVCMIRDCDCRRFRVNAPTDGCVCGSVDDFHLPACYETADNARCALNASTTEIVRIDKYTIRVNGFECVADTVTENRIREMTPEQIEKFLRVLGFRGESATKKRGVTYGDS